MKRWPYLKRQMLMCSYLVKQSFFYDFHRTLCEGTVKVAELSLFDHAMSAKLSSASSYKEFAQYLSVDWMLHWLNTFIYCLNS